jgi:hypothetical protein
MGKHEKPYEKIYERDKATNSFIISVAIEKYAAVLATRQSFFST